MPGTRASRIAAISAAVVMFAACHGRQHDRSALLDADSGMTLLAGDAGLGAAPPVGMVFIPPGPLVVGTPPNAVPRRPDRELAGEQFILHGFYIDKLPYPNEEGAIPTTNVNQAMARELCERRAKRLCTELEWERACKGPSQRTFEYGNAYREEICGTGTVVVPRPSGFNVGCQSDFGVHDMHGSVFEWTSSAWNRGTTNPNRVAIRGGNDISGEVVARCANAEQRTAETRAQALGFRCCTGPANEVQVQMRVERGAPVAAVNPDPGLLKRMLARLPPEGGKDYAGGSTVPVFTFVWRPIGNERLIAMSICARAHAVQRCSMLVGRDTPGLPTVLGIASTGFFPSKLYVDEVPRDAWVLGTDVKGPFRRLLRYDYGRLDIGPRELQSKPKHLKKSNRSRPAATSE